MLTAQQMKELKAAVKKEVLRRNASAGSLASYGSKEWDFDVEPTKGNITLASQGKKVLEPLLAISDWESEKYGIAHHAVGVPQAGGIYPPDFSYEAGIFTWVNKLGEETMTGSYSSCRTQCSGLCSAGCSGTNTGYGGYGCGGCDGGCSGCGGGCEGSCNWGCDADCASDCQNTGCGKYCTAAAHETYKDQCTGASCTGGCGTSCGGCDGSCQGGCYTACSNGCQGSCGQACQGCTGKGCGSTCTGCAGGCSGGCSNGCKGTCTNSCTGCSDSCQSQCWGTCLAGCWGTSQ